MQATPQVRKIEATSFQQPKRRIGVYVRVSSDSSDQQNSYASQISYYTALIEKHPEWELVDVYADATVIIGLKQNPTHGRRFSPIFFA